MNQNRLPPRIYKFLIYAFVLAVANGVGLAGWSWTLMAHLGENSEGVAKLHSLSADLTIGTSALYSVCFGLLVYFDARNRKQDRVLWTIIAVLFQIEGTILYFVYIVADKLMGEEPDNQPPEPTPTAVTLAASASDALRRDESHPSRQP